MRRKTFPALTFTVALLWIAVFSAVVIFQFGCSGSNDHPDQSATDNWIAMDIKFKAGTTDEMRDVSIKAIEKTGGRFSYRDEKWQIPELFTSY